jgi:hypothetical protein
MHIPMPSTHRGEGPLPRHRRTAGFRDSLSVLLAAPTTSKRKAPVRASTRTVEVRFLWKQILI